jgi:Tn3 transposase DDE domain
MLAGVSQLAMLDELAVVNTALKATPFAWLADRGTETQQFRASGLNLVIAAIVYWNSTYIADAVAHLQGKEDVDDALLAHAMPLTCEHIEFSGDFLWDRAAATASKRRPLNLGHMRQAAYGPLFAKSSPLALFI